MRSLAKSRKNESVVTEIPIYPHLKKKITLFLEFFIPQIMFDRGLGLCSDWSLESLIVSDLHRCSIGITFGSMAHKLAVLRGELELCWKSSALFCIRCFLLF